MRGLFHVQPRAHASRRVLSRRLPRREVQDTARSTFLEAGATVRLSSSETPRCTAPCAWTRRPARMPAVAPLSGCRVARSWGCLWWRARRCPPGPIVSGALEGCFSRRRPTPLVRGNRSGSSSGEDSAAFAFRSRCREDRCASLQRSHCRLHPRLAKGGMSQGNCTIWCLGVARR